MPRCNIDHSGRDTKRSITPLSRQCDTDCSRRVAGSTSECHLCVGGRPMLPRWPLCSKRKVDFVASAPVRHSPRPRGTFSSWCTLPALDNSIAGVDLDSPPSSIMRRPCSLYLLESNICICDRCSIFNPNTPALAIYAESDLNTSLIATRDKLGVYRSTRICSPSHMTSV